MKSQLVRKAASMVVLAMVGCTSGQLDDATSLDGSSDQKNLTQVVAQAPVMRGVFHAKNSQPKRDAAVTNTAPANAHLTYYGGNIIENGKFTNVYWGAYWASGAGLTERNWYNGFTAAVPTSPEFNSAMVEFTGAGGKSIHVGSYLGEKSISGEPPKTIDDSVIKTTIQGWVNQGIVPAPSLDQVYVLYFPPNVSITMGSDGSCTTFCGYHSTIQTASGTGGLIRYVVVPHPDCGGCQFEATVKDSVTVVVSHEIWEASTDADVGLATTLGPPLGWYDQNNGENGDICAGDPNANLHGYRVQTTWSNAENKCVASRNIGTPTPDFSLSASPASQTVTQGASTSYAVTATASNGFTGTISYSVSGLPSGASGSFSGTTLNVATTSSAAAGTSTLTITGTSGSLSHTATVSLTINRASSPDFSLSASPSSVSVGAGKSASATISAAASGGFNSGIALSASGLPAGVTAAFAPASITGSGSASLTFTASASAAASSSTVTVTGTAGALSHTASVRLTVTAAAQPDFSVALSPASLSVTQGASGTSSISVAAANGFSDSVALSVSGAPAGVTATSDHASLSGSGSATLTVAASASAAAGTYSLTVTGASGSLSHSATLSLTVKGSAPKGVVFSDDAESGMGQWTTYSQNARDPQWSIEATSASNSGTHRFRSNAGRNYANNTATFLISKAFSLSGSSKANLSFVYKYATESSFDFFYVWASGDNGATWKQIAYGSGTSQGWNRWAPQANIDLSAFAGSAQVRIAFSLQSDYSVTDWGVGLDDISVTAQ